MSGHAGTAGRIDLYFSQTNKSSYKSKTRCRRSGKQEAGQANARKF